MHRFLNPPLIGATLVLATLAAVSLGWWWLREGRPDHFPLTALLAACLPIVLPVLVPGGSDRSQFAITVWAVAMFAALVPGYYVLSSGPENWLVQWRFMLLYGVLYLGLLAIFLILVAPWAARVAPAPGVLPAAEFRLKQRILSLAQAGIGVDVEQSMTEPDRMDIRCDYRDGKRTIGLRLTFVADSHRVLAREYSIIRGDKPKNADEANMRGGPQPRDGMHPDASLIYEANLNVTPASESRRRKMGLRITGDQVDVGPDAASDPTNLPHVLTELVVQSGWTWQGVFFNLQGR